MERLRIGLIGCGMISDIYLKNLTTMFSDVVEVVCCADTMADRAAATAEKYGIKAVTVDEVIESDAVELVLNLTIPLAHYEINKRALLAGKHAYCEKPLAIKVGQASELVALAEARGLYVASAPDTFLGGGFQTIRKLLDEGVIGTPVSVTGVMLASGPEAFHPNPEFLYQKGAGPLFDMGPYYIAALISLFGPVSRVAGLARRTFAERTITGPKRTGEKFPCEVDSYITGLLEFECGVLANLTTTWDMPFPYWESDLPLMEIFGSTGTLILPDPNTFCGITGHPMREVGHFVRLRKGSGAFEDIPVVYGFIENSRGIGLADAACAIRGGYMPRVSPTLSQHIVEIMNGMLNSSQSGAYVELHNACERPASLYVGPSFLNKE